MKPVYIVSSFHRSGSSMMMRCLEAGGIEAVYDPLLDSEWNTVAGLTGYIPNPNGFYHQDDLQVDWPTFHLDHQGKVIKVSRASLSWLSAGRYKLIFMTRNPQEILASMQRFSPFSSWGNMEVNVHLYDLVKKNTLDQIRTRADFEIIEMDYLDVINDPLKRFVAIREFGFPINVEKAASMVDKSLYRLRAEQIA